MLMGIRGSVSCDILLLFCRQTQGRLNLVGAGHLQILNVKESDAGTYTCRAENQEDSIDADASLAVLGMLNRTSIFTNR